jgi:hypothetical protein
MKKSIYPDWLRGFGERADYNKLTAREWRAMERIAGWHQPHNTTADGGKKEQEKDGEAP